MEHFSPSFLGQKIVILDSILTRSTMVEFLMYCVLKDSMNCNCIFDQLVMALQLHFLKDFFYNFLKSH